MTTLIDGYAAGLFEVASLAIGAAETIVQKNLDHETQVQLVENYIRQVGSRS